MRLVVAMVLVGSADLIGQDASLEALAILESRELTDGIVNCGSVERARYAARRVSRGGSVVLPELERRVARFEKEGPTLPGDGWILMAYANIVGLDAVPRLRRMLEASGDPSSAAISIANAMRVTDYLDSRMLWPKGPPMCGVPEPADALSAFVVAWLRGESLERLETRLTPSARLAFRRQLAGTSLARLRRGLLGHWRERPIGLTYRFQSDGQWGAPREPRRPNEITDWPPTVELKTNILRPDGSPCASRMIRFERVEVRARMAQYLIAERDVRKLLSDLSACSGE